MSRATPTINRLAFIICFTRRIKIERRSLQIRLYLAFRAAFVTTLDVLFREFQEPASLLAEKGFLERLPLLSGCAPQVQLDRLLHAWGQLQSDVPGELSGLDRCVCYCAAAELAQLGTLEDARRIERAVAGPRTLQAIDCLWLASKLRTLQITWPFDQDCGTVLRDGNFLDANLDLVPGNSSYAETATQMLELSGRWAVSPRLLSNTSGLATAEEQNKLSAFFQHHPGLMNL